MVCFLKFEWSSSSCCPCSKRCFCPSFLLVLLEVRIFITVVGVFGVVFRIVWLDFSPFLVFRFFVGALLFLITDRHFEHRRYIFYDISIKIFIVNNTFFGPLGERERFVFCRLSNIVEMWKLCRIQRSSSFYISLFVTLMEFMIIIYVCS